MSAFVMDEKFFDRLASELLAHAVLKHSKLNWPVTHVLDLRGDEYSHAEEKIRAAVSEFYQLNVASVNYRYKEDYQPMSLMFTEASGMSKWSNEQLFKHLECLSYQCAEGDCENNPVYQKLERLIGAIARAIVGESDKYEQAKWDYAD